MESIFEPKIMLEALANSITKLDPRTLWKNPVMFSVEIGSIITTLNAFYALATGGDVLFPVLISIWLWLTVVFATFSEALAEIRGRARADELRKMREHVMAKRVKTPSFDAEYETVPASALKKDDLVLVDTNDIIPSDGEVVAGAAVVNESAVTGESAPVIRESGGDRAGVVAGTKVVSNKIIVQTTVSPGEGFIDKMIGMIEAAKRPKTPNEVALDILLISLTAIFIFVVINFWALSVFSVGQVGNGTPVGIVVLVSLFVCLAPTTIAALLPAIGIAGMDRLFRKNVIALSGRAVEAAGDITAIMLDKTGTITHGNRQAVEFIPVNGHSENEVAEAALMSSLNDETPEGKSTEDLAIKKYGIQRVPLSPDARFIQFSPRTRMSGVDENGISYRKGAPDAILEYAKTNGGHVHDDINELVANIAETGGTPLLVCRNNDVLGVIHLKDVLKDGIKEKIARIREMGIKTIIITGDNPLTAAHIAKEAGVDEFVAQAKPEDKLRIVREQQKDGLMVAMTGDGTNDAPALAQADVALAMNAGTQAAKEAANLVDLDSDPTKLIETVEVGKQLLITRGALTTFSIANDIAKYFAIIPAALYTVYPQLGVLNIMGLHSAQSAVLSAVIFNAIIIVLLIPLALRGIKFKPMSTEKLFVYNLLIYGVGGIIAPFIGIKLIDLLIGLFM